MAFGLVGMAARHKLIDHRNHLGDILRGPRRMIRPRIAQCIHIGVVPGNGFLCALGDQFFQRARITRLFARQRRCVNFIIHIGEIAHIGHSIWPIDMAQQAVEHVKHDHRPRITQMRPIIHRGPAQIHAQVRGINWHKPFFLAGLGVVKANVAHLILARYQRGLSNFV